MLHLYGVVAFFSLFLSLHLHSRSSWGETSVSSVLLLCCCQHLWQLQHFVGVDITHAEMDSMCTKCGIYAR